jgi:hypothetical protein
MLLSGCLTIGLQYEQTSKQISMESLWLKKFDLTGAHFRLTAILIITSSFWILRWPYLGQPFGAVIHADKNIAHIPILLNMYETLNPFYQSNPGYVSVITNPTGTFKNFWRFPIYEWLMLPFMPLSELISVETLTRGFLTAWGSILLIIIYRVFEKIFDSVLAFFGTLLLSVNEVFNLITYVTVMDLPALTFMFLSLYAYLNGNRNKSYFLCGITLLFKLSFVLILPTILGLLILREQKYEFLNISELGLLSLIPYIANKFTVSITPSYHPLISVSLTILFICIILPAKILVDKYEIVAQRYLDSYSRNLRLSLIPILPLLAVVVLWDTIQMYAGMFLTDSTFILNWPVYDTLLLITSNRVPEAIYFLLPLGILSTVLYKKHRYLIFVFFFSAVCYNVIAIKGVYIHRYYKHISVIVIIISFLSLLKFITEYTRASSYIKTYGILIIVLALTLSSGLMTTATLDKSIEGTEAMSDYIESNNLQEQGIFLWTDYDARTFVIYNDVRQTRLKTVDTPQVRESVQQNGFGTAMNRYGVNYYISRGKGNFGYFAQFYQPAKNDSSGREDYILQDAGIKSNSNYLEDNGESRNMTKYFELEHQVGDWYLYRIKSGS